MSRFEALLIVFEVIEMLLTFVLVAQSIALLGQYCRGELRGGGSGGGYSKSQGSQRRRKGAPASLHGGGSNERGNSSEGTADDGSSSAYGYGGDPLLDVPRLAARMNGTVVDGIDGEDPLPPSMPGDHSEPLITPELRSRINVLLWADDSPAMNNPLAIRNNIEASKNRGRVEDDD